MNSTLLTWLLAGALAASLYFHLPVQRELACDDASACTPTSASCWVDCAALAVTPEQSAALERTSWPACRASGELEAQSRARLAVLVDELASPTFDATRARALVREIGDLETRSLDACVDTVVAVRSVLTPEQVAELVRCCSIAPAARD